MWKLNTLSKSICVFLTPAYVGRREVMFSQVCVCLREGVPTPARGYLPRVGGGIPASDGWGGGIYLGWGRGYLPWTGRYLPWMGVEGYLPWTGGEHLPWMGRWGCLHWTGGGGTYLGWGRGTYLGWREGYLPRMGERVPILDRKKGYLSWTGYTTRGMPPAASPPARGLSCFYIWKAQSFQKGIPVSEPSIHLFRYEIRTLSLRENHKVVVALPISFWCPLSLSQPVWTIPNNNNKKVLLRERKRHTARRVASARNAGGWGSGGVPHLRSRGVPHPRSEGGGTQWAHPDLVRGG